MTEKSPLCMDLFECGAVKFGVFTLKSGLKSPIYIDLRPIVSHPKILKRVARELKEIAQPLEFDRVAGIPYAAIPIATALSLETNWPMIYTRKEIKEYGTRKQIEGEFKEGETVLVVDDLITTGSSKFDVIQPLQEAGLLVKDIAVLIDREQGGKEELAKKDLKLHAVLTISELLETLYEDEKITPHQYADIKTYFSNPEKWGVYK
ncbi:MAG: orotate phosphoribosyltransferase [Candidatus Diapherotrites archaeon]|nr:orotate phosphoribosyltransferase [Candidatus Diapherotrites archaeon]